MGRKIEDVEADLTAVSGDLDSIKTAVTTTVVGDQATIADLQAQIQTLKDQLAAGGTLDPAAFDVMAGHADALKASADALLAAVSPAPPVAAPPVDAPPGV